MPKTEEGEFELVLGNKQLLSVFFIVVVLLGVFFAMGYIAGRNTVGGTKEVAASPPIIVEAGKPVATQTALKEADKPATQDPERPPAKELVKEPAKESNKPAKEPERAAREPEEKHTTTASVTPARKEEQHAAAPPPKPVSIPEPKTTAAAPPINPPAQSTAEGTEPPPGTYLQVAATTKAEGNLLMQVLGKRGFDAKLAQVPGQEMYRVVVGPMENAQALAKTRDDLKAAGFKPFTRKF